jgi:DNA (cytosine-5)-methyltransferase 1
MNLKIKQATKKGYVECPMGGVFDIAYPTSKFRRGRVQDGGKISPAITCNMTLCVFEGINNKSSDK